MTATAELPDLGEVKIKPQAKLVYGILARGGEMSLPAIRREAHRKMICCLETSISARVRELNAYFRDNGLPMRIVHRYPHGSNTTLYRIDMTTPDRAL